MSEVKYTIDQQAAITASGQNIIVSAGAGSGKTQVLTARVVHFIKNKHYSLDEFLILTFTNLAAGEMKNRIRKALENEGLEDYRKVDTASICTFDSYALSIVKKYHLLLNVSKDVSIIDSNLIEVRKRTILNDIFETYYEQADLIFCLMIEQFCFKKDDDIKNLILKIYQKAILENDTHLYLDNFINNYFNDLKINDITTTLHKFILEDLTKLKALINKLSLDILKKDDPRPLKHAVKELFDPVFNASNYDELINVFPFKLGITKPRNMLDSDTENFEKFKKEYTRVQKYLKKYPKSEQEIKEKIFNNINYAEKMIEIIKILDEKINQYKANYQVYEFSDIAKMALKLVKENKEIKDDIKNNLKMIMIDEYQDTSFLQEAFINEIENNNVYMVGDVKQSIYRFRNARCDIFVDKYEQYKYHGKGIAIDLKKNFRSRKEVLDDINYIFKNIMTKECGGAAYLEDHLIEFGNQSYEIAKPDNLTHSEFLTYEPLGFKQPRIEAELIARDIINKINNHYQVMTKDEQGHPTLRDATYSDFCILMDRGTNFDLYTKVFNEYQIPLFVEYDENIASTQIVLILINLLKVVKGILYHESFNNYKQAYVSLARSFLYNKTDEEIYHIIKDKTYYQSDIITQIKEILNEIKAYPFVIQFEKLILSLDIYNKCIISGDVTRNEKYLDTFINLFNSLAHLDYNVEDLINYLELIDQYNLKITLPSSGSNIDSVKLMNIHKSKGLEFNIVYYSGLTSNFNEQEYKESFNISTRYGLILPPESDEETDVIKIVNKYQETKEDLSEHVRLFYVALTRAKEKMIFVCPSAETIIIKEELENNLYQKYIQENHFYTLDIKEQYQLLLTSYLNQEINYNVFIKVAKIAELYYPSDLDANDNTTTEEKITKITTYFSNLLDIYKEIKNLPGNKPVYILYEYAQAEKITKDEFDYLLSKLKKQIDDPDFEFLESKIKDSSIKDIILKEQIIHHYAIQNIINAYLEEQIDFEFVKKYFKCFNIEINLQRFKKLILEEETLYNINFNNFYNNLVNNFTNIKELNLAFSLASYTSTYINQLDITYALSNLGKTNKDFNLFTKVVNLLGYELSATASKDLPKLITKPSDEVIIDIYSKPFDEYFMPTSNIINDITNQSSFIGELTLKKIYQLFKDSIITNEELINLINVISFEEDIDFKILKTDDKKQFQIEDIDKLFVEQKSITLTSAKNLMELLVYFDTYRKYNHNTYLLDVKPELINKKPNELEAESLILQSFYVPKKQKEIRRASKKVDITASQKLMDFGTQLHQILEMTNFINPNYDLIENKYYQEIVRNFLSSNLLNNIKSAKIFKEYEFIDQLNQTKGIIDLMLVYENYIDIIDYKTKNIEDGAYNMQLEIYYNYIKQTTNKTINVYLYSLLTNEVKKIK